MPTLPDDFCDLIGAPSPLDRPLTVSKFPSVAANKITAVKVSLRELASNIHTPRADRKAALPLLKMAAFGNVRTEKGSLRNDENLQAISGIEADYDGGTLSIADAAALLHEAGIAALIYSSPSYTTAEPRWRVICPLAEDASADRRAMLCARLNGALGGVLAPESFNASQAYYYGAVAGGSALVAQLVDGRAIDRADDLDCQALGRDGKPFDPDAVDRKTTLESVEPFDAARVKEALSFIPATDDRDEWLRIGAAVHHASSGSGEGYTLWDDWSKPSGKYEERDQKKTWGRFKSDSKKRPITIGTLYAAAIAHGWSPPQPEFDISELEDLDPLPCALTGEKRRRLSFFTPTQCAAEPTRGYVVKGLVAPGDVGCIYGAPGSGKSLISPHLGYAVARGVPAFGMRTKPGLVIYVAAEDSRGMKDRVRALRIRHGDAPEFQVVEGVTDLLAGGSEDLAELRAYVSEHKPSLIFIDTLAMAFPGLEENSADGMGRVVAAATSLTKASNAAVILIHHDTKAQTATPRGHSLLNGALDFALQLFPRDETGIVRGRLSKNRNGPCDRDIAFRIDTEQLGVDEDGDHITAALVSELAPGAAPPRIKLAPSEIAARRILDSLPASIDGSVCEKAWREACVLGRAVSGAEDPDSRRKATGRAVQGLVRKGLISVRNGRVYPDLVAVNQPDDLDP